MAYKRYIKRGNKLYGPYVYHSRKEKGKVISEYRGKPPKNKLLIFLIISLFFLLFLIFILTYNSNLIISPLTIETITGGVVFGNLENESERENVAWISFYLSLIKAEHLDSNKNFMSDIYEEVRELDDVWSEEIPDGDYLRVTFEENLTSHNDITVFPRITGGSPRIEVYEAEKDELIAEFSSLNENEYNKVFLTNFQGTQDTFDLRIVGGSLEFDHIVDPTAPTFITNETTVITTAQTDHDIVIPTNQEDDLIMIVMSGSSGTVTFTPPDGNWTELYDETITAASNSHIYAAYRFAPAGGLSSPQNFVSTAAEGIQAIAAVYRGVDTGDPINNNSGTNQQTGTAPVSESITTTVNNTMVLRMVWTDAAAAQTCPPSAELTCVAALATSTPSNGNVVALAHAVNATAGETGTVTWSGTEENGAATVALNPILNTAPTTPTNISCDGGHCNITVDTSVDINASGSTDPDGDAINYTIEASLKTIETISNTTDVQKIEGGSPYLYVYQNNEYNFFSDFIGRATSPIKEYTDFIDITGKTDVVNDKIKLKITEELDERAYIDRIYLLIDNKIVNPSFISNDEFSLIRDSDNKYLIMEKGDEFYLEFDSPKGFSKIEFVGEGYYIKNPSPEVSSTKAEISSQPQTLQNLFTQIINNVRNKFLSLFSSNDITTPFYTKTGNYTVYTDKDDYAPGETVPMSGEGFVPYAKLHIKVTRPDGSIVSGDGTFEPWPKDYDTINTNWKGKFTFDYILNGIQGDYFVEIIDKKNDVLTTHLFKDGHGSAYNDTLPAFWGPNINATDNCVDRVDAVYNISFCVGNGGACAGGRTVDTVNILFPQNYTIGSTATVRDRVGNNDAISIGQTDNVAVTVTTTSGDGGVIFIDVDGAGVDPGAFNSEFQIITGITNPNITGPTGDFGMNGTTNIVADAATDDNTTIITCAPTVTNETNTTYTTYNDLDSDFKSINNITITIEVDSYDPRASVNQSTQDPDLYLEIYNGTAWITIGDFDLNESYTGDALNTTNANFTQTTTDSGILTGWQTSTNQDVRIKGILMDNNGSIKDEINYTTIRFTIDGTKWTEIGNHTEATNLTWNTTDVPEQNNIDFRARAIDPSGTNAYSAYFTKNAALNISHVPAGDQPPTVTIIYPQNIFYNINVTELNYTATDDVSLSHCWYSLDQGATNSSPDASCGNFTGLSSSEGSNTWRVYANDSIGQESSDTVTFTKDTINPNIQFVAPTETSGSFINTNVIDINVTASDTNLDTITIRLYNSTNDLVETNTSTTSPFFINYTNLADGLYFFNATVNDSATNENSTETKNVTIDTTNPSIDYTTGTPVDNANLSQNYIFVNVSVTETNFANITYKLFNSTALVNETTYTTQTLNINWTSLPDETYTYNVTIVDQAINENSTATRTVTLDTLKPNIQFVTRTTSEGNFSQNYIEANVTASDDNLDTITIYLYNSTALVQTNTSTTSTFFVNFTNLPDETYSLNATANDTAGNENSTETRTIVLDITAPTINFVAPTETGGSFISETKIDINVTASDIHLDIITIRLYNSSNDLIETNTSTTSPFYINYTNLADGIYFFNSTANDSASNEANTATRNVTIDTVLPTITILFPANTTYNINVSELNYSASDTNLYSCWYSLDQGVTNSTPDASCPNFTGLSSGEGSNTWTVYANDSAGNENSSSVTFFKDTINPLIEFATGTENNDTFFSRNWIFANVTATEVNEDTITFSLYNSSGLVNETSYTDATRNINWTGLTEETYTYNVTINDTVGNSNNTETRFITLDTTLPNIEFISPTTATGNFSQNYIEANVSASDTNLDTITIRLYNDSGLVNSSSNTTSPHFFNFTNLQDGTYYLNSTANDTAGNENQTETRIIILDTTNPSVAYNPSTDSDNSFVNRNWILVNISATDTNLDAVRMEFNGANETFLNNVGNDYWENKTSLSDGAYSFYAWANDSAGNFNSTATRTVTVDTTNPLISYTTGTPVDNANLSQNYIFVNVSVTETNFANITYKLFNSTALVNETTYTTQTLNINWTSLLDETYTYNVTVVDQASNENSTVTRTATIDTGPPSMNYVSPTESSGVSRARDYVEVNVTASDPNLDTITIRLYNSSNSLIRENLSTISPFFINYTNLADGVYFYNSSANDTFNNIADLETRNITLDTTSPNIQFVTPTTATGNFSQNFIEANVTASDTNLDTITIFLYNSTALVQSNTSSISPLFVNFTGLPDETYYLNSSANDSLGNENQTETRTIILDSTPPQISYNSNTDADNSFVNRNWIFINVTASDLTKDSVRLDFNGVNETFDNSNGDLYWENKTSLSDGAYSFYAWINDTSGNFNSTATRTVTVDTTNPSITSLTESPTDPATYVQGATYEFNATISDTNLDIVLIEFDGTNYTPTNLSGDVYNLTLTDLAAGTYNYYWYANDSAGNVNATSVQTYTINNATGDITLLINDSASNQTGTYGIQTNASASTLYGTLTLYRNGTDVTSENNIFVTLAANYYNYTAVSSGDQNHSSASTTLFVDISKAQSEVNLTLNETDGNVTIVQDSTVPINLTTVSGDSGATLKLYRNGVLINQGTSPLGNQTTFNTVGVFNITGIYLESENYTESFETWYVNVTETPDTTNPSVTSLTESPSDPATYDSSNVYEFNATVTDNRNVSVVLIEFDGINHTPTNLVGDVYNFTTAGLSVGTYNYRWYANDTSGNTNNTENGSYTINQATPSLSLVITPSTTETYPTETTATGSNCPSQLTCNLYRDGVSVSNPETITLGAATYNYTYNTTGNTNYTSASASENLTINQNAGACDVLFNETSPITYPTTFRVWSDCNSAFTLYRNGTAISNNSAQNLAATSYNFTVIRTDNSNYSNIYGEETFIIQKATGVVFTYLNNSRANITIEQYTEIYLNGTLETGSGNIKLYNNGTLINQGASPLSNLTNFTDIGLFNITTQYDGNENYTSAFETWWVNVTELDVTPPQISIDYPTNTTYNAVQTQLNYTASDNFGLNSCWYSLDNGITNITTTCGENVSGLNSGQGSSTWRVYANDAKGNENSSSVTFFVDSINPTIQFVSPTETSGSSIGRNYIQVNVTALDTALDTITIRLYNSTSLVQTNASSSSPFFINYTNLADGLYFFNATVNDTLNNKADSETRNISLVLPNLTISSPKNKTYFSNTSLLLNFSADFEDFVWYNIDNGANITITSSLNFNTSEGGHTLYLFSNNSNGETVKNITFTVDSNLFTIIYDEFKGKGDSIKFEIYSFDEIQTLSNIILETTGSGKIVFNEAINITDDANTSDSETNLDNNINISSNRIELNSSSLPNFNKNATLYLYNLTFSNPRILRDASICPSTICKQNSYSGGTLSFNVTGFTIYSAEETPIAEEPSEAGAGAAAEGSGVVECTDDSVCETDEVCLNFNCVKLFDVKIIDFESPVKLGEFFDFTYFIKGTAEINNDVEVRFWIEKNGEIITSGLDTIYLGSFEEKTETTKIFLPSTVETGIYDFIVQVNHEGYSAKSQRTIEIKVGEGRIVAIGPTDVKDIKPQIIFILVILGFFILFLIFYLERNELKTGFIQKRTNLLSQFRDWEEKRRAIKLLREKPKLVIEEKPEPVIEEPSKIQIEETLRPEKREDIKERSKIAVIGGKAIEQMHNDVFYLLKRIFGKKPQEAIIRDFETAFVKTGKFTDSHLKTLRDIVNARMEFKLNKYNLYHKIDDIRKSAEVLIHDLVSHLSKINVKEKKKIESKMKHHLSGASMIRNLYRKFFRKIREPVKKIKIYRLEKKEADLSDILKEQKTYPPPKLPKLRYDKKTAEQLIEEVDSEEKKPLEEEKIEKPKIKIIPKEEPTEKIKIIKEKPVQKPIRELSQKLKPVQKEQPIPKRKSVAELIAEARGEKPLEKQTKEQSKPTEEKKEPKDIIEDMVEKEKQKKSSKFKKET